MVHLVRIYCKNCISISFHVRRLTQLKHLSFNKLRKNKKFIKKNHRTSHKTKFYPRKTQNLVCFIYSPTDAQVNCLKKILKFTLEQLRHISVLQLHHHQGAH